MMRKTILSFLDDGARRGRGETALAGWRGLRLVRWSYARLAETAYACARELEARGVGRGERVLLWGANSPEWVAAFFGCALRGAIVVPLDVESTPDFVGRVREQTGAKLLLAGGERECQAAQGLDFVRLDEMDTIVARRGMARYEAEAIGGGDILEIIYTSGTTAEPRGVCLTHGNLLSNLAPLEEGIGKYARLERLTVHPLRFLNLLPLSHVFGQFMGIFVPQLLGGEVYFQDSLNPSEIANTVRKRRISVVVAVPRLLDTLRDYVGRVYAGRGQRESFERQLEAARGWHLMRRWWVFRRVHGKFGWKFWAFVSGGATLDAATETFWRRLGFAVLQGYGMTETASLISVNHPFKMGRGSVGKSLPGQEIKLNEHGEIMVRGAHVSPGYWKGGVEPLTDGEGWLHTGDLGEMDEAGNIYFKGREKDVIVNAAGLNIHPEDLEAALNRQPEIRMSAVVGVEGARGTEPLAVLIMRERQTDASQAIERANAQLARHQQILRWHIWPENDFPRTPTHKIRKRDILERIADESGKVGNGERGKGKEEKGADEVERIVSSLVSGSSPVAVGASSRLATDLKLDSLGRVELLSALEERFQLEIDEAAFTAATTVGDIEKIIRQDTREDESTAEPYPYPEWAQKFPVTWLRLALLYLLTLPVTWLLCPVRVRGARRLDALGDSPALFVSNHITFVDHALILSALPGRYRRRFAVAQEGERLRRWRHLPEDTSLLTRLRWLAQYYLVVVFFNTFSLPQKSGFRRSFAYAGESVDRGYSVLVFPEGARTEDGRLRPFMSGTGLLATRLRVPVVPVRIEGLFELKRRGRRFFAPRGSVSVTFGEPVRFDAGEEDAARVTKELERRVGELG